MKVLIKILPVLWPPKIIIDFLIFLTGFSDFFFIWNQIQLYYYPDKGGEIMATARRESRGEARRGERRDVARLDIRVDRDVSDARREAAEARKEAAEARREASEARREAAEARRMIEERLLGARRR